MEIKGIVTYKKRLINTYNLFMVFVAIIISTYVYISLSENTNLLNKVVVKHLSIGNLLLIINMLVIIIFILFLLFFVKNNKKVFLENKIRSMIKGNEVFLRREDYFKSSHYHSTTQIATTSSSEVLSKKRIVDSTTINYIYNFENEELIMMIKNTTDMNINFMVEYKNKHDELEELIRNKLEVKKIKVMKKDFAINIKLKLKI